MPAHRSAIPPNRSTARVRCAGGESRGAPVRRADRLLGRVVQRGRRAVARPAAERLGRGRGDRAPAARSLGERLLHAQGSRGRLVGRRHDGARQVRRARPRPRERRARPRLRPRGALRAARRVQAPCAHGRTLRARSAPRDARAAQGEARGGGSLRGRAEAGAALPPAPGRHRHRQRRSREARRRHDDPVALPAGPRRSSRRRTSKGRARPRRSSPRSTRSASSRTST